MWEQLRGMLTRSQAHTSRILLAHHAEGCPTSFIQYSPTIKEIHVQVILTRFDWPTPIISYLKKGNTLEDHNTSRRLKVQASRFVLIGDILYKRGFSRPYLKWFSNEVDYIMREVHEGVCENHSRACSLVHKLI